MISKIITSIHISLTTDGDDLKDLKQGVHGQLTRCSRNVALIHDECSGWVFILEPNDGGAECVYPIEVYSQYVFTHNHGVEVVLTTQVINHELEHV